MSVILAATWNPRGEAKRLRKLYPQLKHLYPHMIIIMPPSTHMGLVLSLRHFEKLTLFVTDNWRDGRRESLAQALKIIPSTSASHIMYADVDRLLRWAETRYEELRQTIKRVQMYDCLVIGRTERAYQTHPQALIQTEAMSNRIFSHLLGEKVDLSAGAKGFSIRAASFVVANARAERPFGADAEWVVLAKRGGFDIRTYHVDGLDWESADRYEDQAVDEEMQQARAAEYDANPENWKMRVDVANEIIDTGLAALTQEILTT